MFSGLVRYLQLTAKAKTGLGRWVVAYGSLATICGFTAFFFFIVAVFIGLAERWGAFNAAAVMCLAFLLLTVLMVILSYVAHRRAVERAKAALEQRKAAQWFDPAMLSTGLQIGRAIGLRRIVPLIAVGVLAATLAKEWLGPGRQGDEDGDGLSDDEGES
jgi:hypothetical protein